MKIEAKDFIIKNILSRKTYTIPDYQREYSWIVNEEISLFWEDFIYYLDGSEDNFFIGPLVFKGENINKDTFDVIDGQQRLVTLIVIFSVIRDLFSELNKKELAKGLQQFLIYKDARSQDKVVLVNESPHPYFQERILNANIGFSPKKNDEELIERARAFFEEKIRGRLEKIKTKNGKIKELEKIREYLFNIDTVLIVSNDEVDAYTIFETINSRGKDLSSLDLVKNYVVKNYPKKAGVKEPISKWKEILKNIEKDKDNFFNRFWASWRKKENESKLYRRFARYVKNEITPFSKADYLLKKLSSASTVYKNIIDPKIDDWKINKNFSVYYSIKNIGGLFGVKVHYPFLMALIEEFREKKINDSLLKEAIQIIEHFHFIFTYIASTRASGLDNKYSKFAINLRKEADKRRVISDLRDELKEKLPSAKEYEEKFQELNFNDNKSGIQYILLKLEKEKSPAINIEIEDHSIDHLEPKSSKWKNINSIGNLFLLEQAYNEDKNETGLFDLWPKNKKSSRETVCKFLIKNTRYKTTKFTLQKLSKWDKLEIEKRTEKLAKETFKLFSRL